MGTHLKLFVNQAVGQDVNHGGATKRILVVVLFRCWDGKTRTWAGREALPLRAVVIRWYEQKWIKAERVDGEQLSASPVQAGGVGCQGLEGERSESSSARPVLGLPVPAGRAGAGRLPACSPACSLPQRGFARAGAKCALSWRESRGENVFLKQFFGLSAKENAWTSRSFHSIQLPPQPHNHKELEIPG